MVLPDRPLDVLFVEDSETDAKLVVRALDLTGFAIGWERVETAAALRNALQRRRWQLVISDSNVPGLGLLDALALTQQQAPGTPFVTVSGAIRRELADEALRRGAAGCVSKTNLEILREVVGRIVHGQAVEGAHPPDPLRELVAAHERERRQIARDLHDQLGQTFVALRLLIESARTASASARTRALAGALTAIDEAIVQVRNLSLELWPTILDDLGLVPALRWLGARHSRLSSLAIELHLDEVGRLPFDVEATCFRIVQEALTNVVRHARARSVEVSLQLGDDAVELAVRDDGDGFDPAAPGRAPSVGIAGMRERVAVVGGVLAIDSPPGAGTTVRASVPLLDLTHGPMRGSR